MAARHPDDAREAGGEARGTGVAPDIVDEVGEDSFPSSDPPSWTWAVAS